MGLFDSKRFDLHSAVGKIQEKISEITQSAESADSQMNNEQQGNPEKSIFCSNCGTRLNKGAKFCHGCGAAVGTVLQKDKQETEAISPILQAPPIPQATLQTNHSERQQEYVGKILKCPNCGAQITETTAICPNCGIQITGKAAVGSVQNFKEQLMSIESSRKRNGIGEMFGFSVDPADQKKLSLIRSFPIPNTVDDILEFMMLAIANIDVSLSKKTINNKYQSSMKSVETSTTMPRTLSDAWVAKMQQVYQKAKILFPNDPAFIGIQKIYYEKMKELKIKVE